MKGLDYDPEEYRRYFKTYDPRTIEADLEFVGEAVDTHIDFEPFKDVGDVYSLLKAAANLAMFAEEYRQRTGGFDLPK